VSFARIASPDEARPFVQATVGNGRGVGSREGRECSGAHDAWVTGYGAEIVRHERGRVFHISGEGRNFYPTFKSWLQDEYTAVLAGLDKCESSEIVSIIDVVDAAVDFSIQWTQARKGTA